MDEGLVRAVRVAFVRWYEQGLIYRGERLVNWCPTDQTGLSDSEVEHEEVDGELLTFRYPLSDGTGHVDVATTRVETMLGDTGIAVHPDDPRYRELIGKTVRHPFDGRDLPIVADEVVDPAFGTGAVKVTPAHDLTDFDIAQRTGLPLDEHPGRGGADQRARRGGVLRARALRRPAGGPRGAREARSVRRRRTPLPALRGSLLPLPQRDRAVDVGAAVVRRGGGPEAPSDRGGARREDHVLARAVAEGLRELDGGPARLEHLAAALVGASHPGVVLPGRARHGGPRGSRRVRDVRFGGARAGPGCPRHVVLLAALAVLDARLARRDTRAPRVLSERRPRHRLRDPLPLGREDDHVRHVARRRHPVPRRGDPRARPGRPRSEDVEVARQRDRSERDDRPPRGRCAAVLAGAVGDRGTAGHPAVGGLDPGWPELREQDLERGPSRPAGVPRGRAAAPAGGSAHRAAALAARAASTLRRRGERRARPVRVRAGGTGHLPLLLVGVLRLGPRDGEGSTAIRRRDRAFGHGQRPRVDPGANAPAACIP